MVGESKKRRRCEELMGGVKEGAKGEEEEQLDRERGMGIEWKEIDIVYSEQKTVDRNNIRQKLGSDESLFAAFM